MENYCKAGFDIGPFIFAFLGLIAVCVAFFVFISAIKKTWRWTKTTGWIEGYVTSGSGKDKRHLPTIKYKVDNQDTISNPGMILSKYKYRIGERVIIYYNPANVAECYLFDLRSFLGFTGLWFAAGVVFIYLSIRLFFG